MAEPRRIPVKVEPFGQALDELIDRARDAGLDAGDIATVLEDRAESERLREEANDGAQG